MNDAVDNKVFDLPKSSDKEKKKFSFLVTIKYRNISKTVTKETDSFYLIGTDNNKRQSSGKHLACTKRYCFDVADDSRVCYVEKDFSSKGIC